MNTLRQLTNFKNVYRTFSNLSTTASASQIKSEAEPQNEPDKLIKTLELEVKGNDPAVLKSFCKFAVTAGNHFELDSKTWTLRKPIHERYTVLKVVHIYKKHRVQYETRTYFAFVQYNHLTGSTADTLLEYVERNLPEGVALKATKLVKILGTVMKNIIQEIGALLKNNVYIKDHENLNEILNNMTQAGIKKLQIVSDFDRTITKQHHNGVPHLSSFAMFSKIPTTARNEQYQNTVLNLRQKYYPIEVDPVMPRQEKIKHMEDWWGQSEKAISGLTIPQQEIDDVCVELKPTLRDGSDAFFKDLANAKVPVLVFSAGCGNIVAAVLKYCGVYLSNVKVISNFLKYNDDGVITGFQEKIIHVFNKNEYAIKNTDFYDVVAGRENAIVLGDSLGDANMTDGMDKVTNVLKIGFLYDHVEQALPEYMDTFDIVLVDDQTMEVPKAIFDYIKDFNIAEI